MKQYRDRRLGVFTLRSVADHMEFCAPCHDRFREVFQERRGDGPAWIALAPAPWLRAEHLAYEQLAAYANWLAEDGLPRDAWTALGGGETGSVNDNEDDREMLAAHLALCARCREDLESLLAHRRELATAERAAARRAPVPEDGRAGAFLERLSMWGGRRMWSWKPALAFLALLMLGGALWGAWRFWRARQAPGPGALATVPAPRGREQAPPSPSPVASPPARSRREAVPAHEPLRLREDGREMIFSGMGQERGVASLRASERDALRETLRTGELASPPVLEDLQLELGWTRSPHLTPDSFQLLAPAQLVVAEDRPVFRWAPLKGARGYRVLAAAQSDWTVIESPVLDAAARSWMPPAPLRRGETYSWAVHALTDQGEAKIPVPEDPEHRFKILNRQDARRLEQLKRRPQSRLVLGVLYARMGLLVEAEEQFRQLAVQNPDVPLVGNLLAQIRQWRLRLP